MSRMPSLSSVSAVSPLHAMSIVLRVCYGSVHVINSRRACPARVTVVGFVCVSVCLSVTQHLASRMFIRPTNDMTYLAGDEGQKFCGVFSENAPLQS